MTGTLADVLRAYPWLQRLPPDVLERLHVAELAPAHPANELLGPAVVVYRTDAAPDPTRVSLCSVLRPAPIAPDRLDTLRAAERRWPGIALVEYQRP